jgi:hypothetical protein
MSDKNIIDKSMLEWYESSEYKDAILEEFGKWPEVGDMVCDCRLDHLPLRQTNYDDVILDDGTVSGRACSLYHCLSNVNHQWSHSDTEGIEEWNW